MAGPFSFFGPPQAPEGVTPPADTFINRLFGPPLNEQARMGEQGQEYQQNSAMAQVAAQAAKLAQDGRTPAEIAQKLLMDPSSGVLEKLSADQIKSVFADIIPSVKPLPTAHPAGNSLFLKSPDTGHFSLGAEGGHTEHGRNPMTGDTIDTYRPGTTFGPDGKPSGTHVYPSASGVDAKAPNNAWWIANANAPPELQQLYALAGQKYNLPPDMLASQGYKESRWNPTAKGALDEEGIAQLRPGTASDMGVVDRNDPAQSIDGQAKYMAWLRDKYNGNYRHALMAYNWGPENVDNWLARGADPAEVPDITDEYVRDISGDTGPLPKIEYRPGMSFKKAMQAYLPPDTQRKANMSEVDRVAMANPALMFAGAGAPQILAEVGANIGRTISPEVESEWLTANNYSRNKLRRLTASIAEYATNAGGNRFVGPFQARMATDPSAGGMFNDPKDALAAAVELHDTMTDRISVLDTYNISNQPKTELDNILREKRLAQRVLLDLPTRDQMTEMQELFRLYPQALPSAQTFLGRAVNFGTKVLEGAQGQAAGNAPEAPPVQVKSKEDWDAIPVGTKYIDPETGRTNIKKAR